MNTTILLTYNINKPTFISMMISLLSLSCCHTCPWICHWQSQPPSSTYFTYRARSGSLCPLSSPDRYSLASAESWPKTPFISLITLCPVSSPADLQLFQTLTTVWETRVRMAPRVWMVLMRTRATVRQAMKGPTVAQVLNCCTVSVRHILHGVLNCKRTVVCTIYNLFM